MVQLIYRIFVRIEEYWLLVVFWALGSVVFAQFFSRYVLNSPLGWTEELARYLMIAVAFLGLPVVTRHGEHIAIDLFVSFLPNTARRWLDVGANLLQLAIVCVLAWQAKTLADNSMQTMSALPFPKSIVYYAVFAGLTLHAIAIVHTLCALIFLRRSENNA